MKKTVFTLSILISTVILSSCDPPTTYGGTFPKGLKRKLLFFTGLDETLCVIDPDNRKIHNNIATTETSPNHLCLLGDELYVTNSLSNSIQVFRYTGDELYENDRIYLGKNSNPWMVIPVDTEKAYVPCFVSDDIAVINLKTRSLIDVDPSTERIDRIKTQEGPEGGCLVDGKLYVGNTAWSSQLFGFKRGSVTIVNTATDKVLKTLWIDPEDYEKGKGSNPQSLIPFPDRHEVHVICTGVQGENDGKVVIIDTITDKVKKTILTGGSPGWADGARDMASKTVFLTGVEGLQAYNYESAEILGKEYKRRGWYIWLGEDTIKDFYSGIYYDSLRDELIVCRFNNNEIMVLQKDDSQTYSKTGRMETYNGPQGNIIALP